MGYYQTGQVCLNGHAINSRVESSPALNSKFCGTCGAPTITKCESCGAAIRGEYEVPGVAAIGFEWESESYCYNCGSAYPWTKTALDTAADFVDETENLSGEDKEQLKASLVHLTKEDPQTELAGSRFKRLIAKVSPEAADGLKKIMIPVASAAAKKWLGL